ncbi:MAG: DUF4839 domain-containing protein [Collinsella bouchesdurhonensis]|nr:DUF4839 domain-containing protein [Collinsella bouchesdurhonensis]
MAFCPKCGNELRTDLHFCPKCGTEIDASRCTPEARRTGPTESVPDNASPDKANNIPPIPHNSANNSTASELSDSLTTAADALGGLAAKAGTIAAGAVGELASRAKDALNDATASTAGKQEMNSTTDDSSAKYRDAAELDEPFEAQPAKSAHSKETSKVFGSIARKSSASISQARNKLRANHAPQRPWRILGIAGIGLAIIVIFVAAAIALSANGSKKTSKPVQDASSYQVHLSVDCSENLFFSRYDLTIYVDSEEIGTLDHGAEDSWDLTLDKGQHTLRVQKKDDSSVDGRKTFKVDQNEKISCTVYAKHDQIEISQLEVKASTDSGNSTEAPSQASKKKKEEKKTDSEPSQKKETEEPEAEDVDSPEQTDEATQPASDQDTVLTTANCPDLATLLSSGDMDASWFVSKYAGKTIEFDGNIAYLAPHANYTTRWDVLINAGDYDPNHALGPEMQYENVNTIDMGFDDSLDEIRTGTNVHIKAIVKDYNASTCLLHLEPVSMSAR